MKKKAARIALVAVGALIAVGMTMCIVQGRTVYAQYERYKNQRRENDLRQMANASGVLNLKKIVHNSFPVAGEK